MPLGYSILRQTGASSVGKLVGAPPTVRVGGLRQRSAPQTTCLFSPVVGVRIGLPVLQVPIQADLAWPIRSEKTGDEEQFFFSIRPIF